MIPLRWGIYSSQIYKKLKVACWLPRAEQREKKENCCVMSTEFQLYKTKILEMFHDNVNILNIAELYT